METTEKDVQKSEVEESEFGKGLSYCLGLFLAHAERDQRLGPELWFNGASDHLYDLQVESAPEELRERLRQFRDRSLHFGHGYTEPYPTADDVGNALEEAKRLLLLIDQANGIPTIEAQWC